MKTLEEIIRNADSELLAEMVQVIMHRYEQLYPDWQISLLALEKSNNYNEQTSRTISLLESMKIGQPENIKLADH